ncbi:MAG: alkaline phosphatase family protein [Verrucomicrobiae bacterium]|nr:alkaline phosphatase family protein [Verrucomicrobiae bacterium]
MVRAVRRVILVGWDGADWRVAEPLIRAGQLPQLGRLVREGVTARLRSLPPYLSPIVWTSMATGKRPHRHGIQGFAEVHPVTRQIQAVSSRSRRCKAVWNILSEAGLGSHAVGWFASHPAEPLHGVSVSEALVRPPTAHDAPWPIPEGSVFPAERLAGMAECRVRPEELDPALLDLLVPRWRELGTSLGGAIPTLLTRLAELYTVHHLAVSLVRDEPASFLAVHYHFLDWIGHDFMAYRPPFREGVDPRAFEFFQDVVDNAYRLQDLLLTDLLNAAGPDTTLVLVSDHGFHTDQRRPLGTSRLATAAAAWHHPMGMLAMGGPGVRAGVTLRRANVLDVTPTVLSLLGLPVAEDMDGRPLWQAMDVPTGPGTIPTWEGREGRLQFPPPSVMESEPGSAALLDQFAALGYLRMPRGEDPVAFAEVETAWNTGVGLMDAGLYEEALPHLEKACFHRPEQGHMAFQLALCQIRLGLDVESRRTEEVMRDAGDGNPRARFILGQLEMARGDHGAALEHFEAVRALAPDLPELATQTGLACLHLERWDRAGEAFDRALEQQSDDPRAWLGRARASLRAGRWGEALSQAEKAVALDDDEALAHLTVAQAAEPLGLGEQALAACMEAFDRQPALLQPIQHLLERLPNSLPGLTKRLEVLEERERQRLAQGVAQTPVATLREAAARRLAEAVRQRAALRASRVPVERWPMPPAPGSSGRTIVVVTGLPRSGTSLMMQMLRLGGLEPMTDGVRAADEDNPEGYLEWEAVRDLPWRPDLLDDAEGRAVKVVAPLLPHLPVQHRYQVIVMGRPAEEIARSQGLFLERRGGTAAPASWMIESLREHQAWLRAYVARHPQFETLTVEYPELVADPGPWVDRLSAFLGTERLPHPAAMRDAVRPELHRNRVTGSPDAGGSDA